MDANALRALQAPLKERYREDPNAGLVTFAARATLDDERIACRVDAKTGPVLAGLHPAAGGTGAAVATGVVVGVALSLVWLVYVATRPPMPLLGLHAGLVDLPSGVLSPLHELPGDRPLSRLETGQPR